MFEKVEIENFRAIKHLEINNLGKVNLLVGENNSSKTSILESLFLLIGFTSPELIIRIHNFRDLLLNEQDDLRFIFHEFDYSNTIKVKANSAETAYRAIEVKPSSTLNSKLQQSKVDLENVSYGASKDEIGVNELLLNTFQKEKHTQKKISTNKLTYYRGGFNLTTSNDIENNLKGVYVTPKISLAENLQKELEKQIVNKNHKELIEILQIIDPRIENISSGSQRVIYADVGLPKLVPFNLLGDGIRRLLFIVLAILSSESGVVLIDELENGMHVSILKKTWKAILNLSEKYNVQLFITTHNIETLKALQETLNQEDLNQFQNSVRSYTIRKLSDKHKAYKYNFENFENALLEGVEIR